MKGRPSPVATSALICFVVALFNNIVFDIDIFTVGFFQKVGYIVLFAIIFTLNIRDNDLETENLDRALQAKDKTIQDYQIKLKKYQRFLDEWEDFAADHVGSEYQKELCALMSKQTSELFAEDSTDEG